MSTPLPAEAGIRTGVVPLRMTEALEVPVASSSRWEPSAPVRATGSTLTTASTLAPVNRLKIVAGLRVKRVRRSTLAWASTLTPALEGVIWAEEPFTVTVTGSSSTSCVWAATAWRASERLIPPTATPEMLEPGARLAVFHQAAPSHSRTRMPRPVTTASAVLRRRDQRRRP